MSMLLEASFLNITWEFVLVVLGIVILAWIISKIDHRNKK